MTSGVDLQVNTGDDQQNMYLSQAGLYFQPSFFARYDLDTSRISQGTVGITDIISSQTIPVQYFTCTNNNSDTDCGRLSEVFTQTAAKTFTTAAGMKFYKQSEVNSRFTTNGLLGYFINDVPEASIVQLTQYLQFVNDNTLARYLIPNIPELCVDASERIATITDTELRYVQRQFVLDVQ